MKAVLSLKRVESINIHRFLRRNSVERFVFGLKVFLAVAALILLALSGLEYFKNSMEVTTKSKKFQNDLENFLKFGSTSQGAAVEQINYNVIACNEASVGTA